jgi:hypothetical protein
MRRRNIKMIFLVISGIILTVVALFLFFFPLKQSTFASFPGFDDYFAVTPRLETAASPKEQDLLEKWRPILYISEGGTAPIDFYRDYIANGSLKRLDGSVVSNNMTLVVLNKWKNNEDVEFSYYPTVLPNNIRATVYARIDKVPVENGLIHRYLRYNFVFPTSGLAAELPSGTNLPAKILGWSNDWHQLDHYTAVTIVLDELEAPIAVFMQQHNLISSYIFGKDLPSPDADNPLAVVAAKGSNELYPLQQNSELRWPVVNFLSTGNLEFMLTGRNGGLFSAFDIAFPQTHPTSYALEFLSPSDAFYSFRGFLGARRRLPGRTGPPGADYNTLPSLKSPQAQLLFGLWRTGDGQVIEIIRRILAKYEMTSEDFSNLQSAFQRLVPR